MTRALLPMTVALAMACGADDRPPELPDPTDVRIADAADTAASGRIAGARWQLEDARFRTVTREGRERVDLLLWDRPIERCGLPLERAGTLVWIRFPGLTALEVGDHRLQAEEGDFGVHYEVADGRSIDGVHRGVASVRFEVVEPGSVRGRLRVCFADTARSCIDGTFDAAPCLSRIDGRALREPPGLADEALEPLLRRPPP